MMVETANALRNFTTNYCQQWQQQYGHAPESEALYSVPSSCIITTRETSVLWQPQRFTLPQNLDAVSHALDLALQPAITAWYTTQFAGDMTARLGTRPLTLLQVWSEDDFIRIQENLIGHLVMKRRLKQSPTLFIATTDSELEVVSLCNLRGEVILEQLGTNKREILSEDVPSFLNALQPDVSL